MSSKIRIRTWAGALFCVGAFALITEGFQRPPPAKDPGIAQAATESVGTGKGELLLPVQGEDGRMSGQLTDWTRLREYHFEALLTGFVPGGPAGQPGYWFGGLYGKVWSIGGTWSLSEGSYGLQGGWKRTDERCGSFWADAVRINAAGRLETVGRLHGQFVCDELGTLGVKADWAEAAPPDKALKPRYRDAAGQPTPREAYGDAASVPRKAWPKTRYEDAGTGWTPPPFRDADSAHKAWPKTRYEDAGTGWTPPPFRDADSAHKAWPKTRYSDAAGSEVPQIHATVHLRFSFEL